MAHHQTRILFVTGEVAPFVRVSEAADLVRLLPERLQETGDFEARITMPRYGTINERKNRLHEVIRLSGTEIPMAHAHETLKVKVASVPGARLQVYFMDNKRYFKRKGLHACEEGRLFEDNAERALFYGRAVLETIQKLMWGPDVIHAFGWVSSLLPLLLHTEYAGAPLFEKTKVVYTPDAPNADARCPEPLIEHLQLAPEHVASSQTLSELGQAHADAVAYPPSLHTTNGLPQLSAEPEALTRQAITLYDGLLTSMAA